MNNNTNIIDIIVDEVKKTLQETPSLPEVRGSHSPIPLGVSNRHIHLTKETFAKLFGVNTPFESYRPLYQPGEFASSHLLTIIGSKMRSIQNVRILGPLRDIPALCQSVRCLDCGGLDTTSQPWPEEPGGRVEGNTHSEVQCQTEQGAVNAEVLGW